MSYIQDGFSTIISFPEKPAIKLKEVEVTPPGIDTGGPVNTTTMRNTAWRTQNAKHLKTLTEMSFTAEYDPAVYDDIIAMARVNQLIVVTFPDGATLSFWGYLDKMAQGNHVEGERPVLSLTVQPTNQNSSGVETAPVFAAAA